MASTMPDRRLCLTSMQSSKTCAISKYRPLPVAASFRDSGAYHQSRELRRPYPDPTRNPLEAIKAAATQQNQQQAALISPASIASISTPQSCPASHPSNRPQYISRKCYPVLSVSLTPRADRFRANNTAHVSRIPVSIKMLRNYTGPLHWATILDLLLVACTSTRPVLLQEPLTASTLPYCTPKATFHL